MNRQYANVDGAGDVDSNAEHRRLADSAARRADWKNWGPYVAERAWGTVREDYSPSGDAWSFFPHDHARSRAYRWNEDGLAGFCNRFQNLCLGLALWNGRDPILKERLFGLANEEGNHGEDVKEYYFYLDGVPSHAYMRMLYKYPQVEYPYARLIAENRGRSRAEPEFELADAIGDALRAARYFDVFVEYAKADQEDILCRVTAINRGPEPAELHVLPHAWFRNTWSWGHDPRRPELRADGPGRVRVEHRHLGERWWYVDTEPCSPGAAVHRERHQRRAALRGAERIAIRQGCLSRIRGRRPTGPGESRTEGDESRGALQDPARPGASIHRPHPTRRPAARRPLRRLR